MNEHGYGENFLFVINMFGEKPGVVSGDKAIKKHYTVQNVTRYLQSQLNDYGTKFNQEMTPIKNTLNALKESRTALEEQPAALNAPQRDPPRPRIASNRHLT